MPEENKRLGDFELLREIGRGGMGVVYEARQISLRRRVALKVLPPGLGLTGQAVQRFEREAQAAAKLHHTNIVPVYATGEDQGCHYFAMELVEGQSLSQVLDGLSGARSNPLMEATVTRLATGAAEAGDAADATDVAEKRPAAEPPPAASGSTTSFSDTDTGGRQWFDTAARLMADVADALHYAHGQGVIHRDVKPANLLLSGDGRLCLGDFGLARVVQEPGMTVSGSFMGTPAYMSPEQVAAGRVKLDHRTDVYSLGAVLYEMLTLRRPFSGDSREQILTGILSKEPRPPRRINPRVPLDLETICLKAMEKDPDRRYATAEGMAADLRQYLQRGLIAARRAGPLRRAGKFVGRHPVATVTVIAVLVVAVLAVFAWNASVRQSREAALRAFADARYFLSQGEHEPALERIETALAQSPELPEARLLRARLLMKQRRYDDAVAEARGMLEADPGDWTGHLILALAANAPPAFRIAGISGDEHLAEVERLAPETADAFHLRALAEEGTAEAVALLDRALAIDPAHAGAIHERSRRHAEQKNFEAALRDADRLVAVRPRSAQGHRLAGRLYVEQHDTEHALEKLADALRIDPDDPITLNERARLYGTLGRYDEAFADLDRAIEMDPEYPRSHLERAELNQALQQLDAAVEDARRAIAIKPDYGEADVLLFNTLFALGRTEELAEEMRRWEEGSAELADTMEPEDRAGLHIGRAYVRMMQQQLEAALADMERAVEIAPDDWSVYGQRAAFRRMLGDAAGANEDCARSAGFELTDANALLTRGRSMLEGFCASPALAMADFSRVIKMAPWWADPYLQRGKALQEAQRHEEARADFDRAIEHAPAWGEAYAARGRHHLRRESFEDALADLDRAAELGLGTQSWGNEEENLLQDRVQARLRLGREPDALALLDGTLAERPEWSAAHATKTLALINLGRTGEALEATDAGIAADREGGGSPFWLGILHPVRAALRGAGSGDCEGARADLEEAERLAGTAVWGPVVLAVVADVQVNVLREYCPALYDGPLALERVRKALAVFENDNFRGTLGAVLYAEEQYDEALEVLQRLDDDLEFDEPDDLFYLAMTHWKLGRRAEARGVYDRAAARLDATYPNDRTLRRQQREAAALLGVGS
jgi:serine/threonine protein kinase/Tfp pilus assembly protein PilF